MQLYTFIFFKSDSTIITAKDGLRWRKLLVKLALSFYIDKTIKI